MAKDGRQRSIPAIAVRADNPPWAGSPRGLSLRRGDPAHFLLTAPLIGASASCRQMSKDRRQRSRPAAALKRTMALVGPPGTHHAWRPGGPFASPLPRSGGSSGFVPTDFDTCRQVLIDFGGDRPFASRRENFNCVRDALRRQKTGVPSPVRRQRGYLTEPPGRPDGEQAIPSARLSVVPEGGASPRPTSAKEDG
jgi:hypothetical protein